MELKELFSLGKIGNIPIKNRIVRSATWEARATEAGHVTNKFINFYDELAKGGTGLIITGYIAVHAKGAATRNMTCLYDDSYIMGQKKLVEKVHDYSDVKICAQIAHTGAGMYNPAYELVAPSPVMEITSRKVARELKNEEIKEIIKAFVDTSLRAYECGYDMVQLHGAHGYLLSDFVSPFSNKRTDEFGGNTQKRIKILLDIYNQIRDELGKSYPITIKLNTHEYLRIGLTFEEGMEITRTLVDAGFDAIEPSCGRINLKYSGKKSFPSVMMKSTEDDNYFLPYVKKLKPMMKKCSIILMGGIRNPLLAEKFLREEITDFISMSRPLIYEPDLPNRWKSGDTSPALCTSCNLCFGSGLKGRGEVYCVIKKKLEKKK